MSESAQKGRFEPGHQPVPQTQEVPGKEADLEPSPHSDQVPNEEGGQKLYQAAGKLKGKKAIITGGDSGIGRASAVLFAMEGGDVLIAYLSEEEEDAQETKKRVEHFGQKCHLFSTDVKDKENCKKIVEIALKEMGGIDVLFNNSAYQMVQENIEEL